LQGYGESRQDEKALLVRDAIPENAFKRLPSIARQTDREKMFRAGTRGPKGPLAISCMLPMESARPENGGPRTVTQSLSFEDCSRAPMQERKRRPGQSVERSG
jgi:hypothetical protein